MFNFLVTPSNSIKKIVVKFTSSRQPPESCGFLFKLEIEAENLDGNLVQYIVVTQLLDAEKVYAIHTKCNWLQTSHPPKQLRNLHGSETGTGSSPAKLHYHGPKCCWRLVHSGPQWLPHCCQQPHICDGIADWVGLAHFSRFRWQSQKCWPSRTSGWCLGPGRLQPRALCCRWHRWWRRSTSVSLVAASFRVGSNLPCSSRRCRVPVLRSCHPPGWSASHSGTLRRTGENLGEDLALPGRHRWQRRKCLMSPD